jgi:hypothetical protein
LRIILKDIKVIVVKVEEVAKVAVVIKKVIIVIRRIKVVEVFKEEDIKDINLRAGLVYIN